MNIYCSTECMSCCDFCINYKDNGNGILGEFEGEGKCLVKNIEVSASYGCEDDFHCFQAEENTDEQD